MEKYDILLDFEQISRVTRLLTQKWNIEIILTLHSERVLRYSELKKLCISQFRGTINSRILVERLKYFQLRGLVERAAHNEFPPRVEYRLTEEGERLAQTLCQALRQFIEIIPHKDSEFLDDDAQLQYMRSRKNLLLKKIDKNVRMYNHIINLVKTVKLYSS